MRLQPVILIDRREQDPFAFANLPSEPGTLNTGDYSVKGLAHLIAVERKSLPDLIACVGRERERFKRELQRLRAFRFRLLVVEASSYILETGGWRGKVKPAQVLGSLSAWVAQYGLPVWLAGSHESAGLFVERYLFQCARCVVSEGEAARALIEAACPEAVTA